MANPLKGISTGTTYRTSSPVLSCAIVEKPTSRGAYVDRVTASYSIVYVLRGRGVFTDWNGIAHDAIAGCAIQMPPGQRHSVVHQPDGQWMEAWVTVSGRFGQTLIDLGMIDAARPLLRPGVDRSIIAQFERLQSTLRQAADRELPLALVAAHELLIAIHQADRRQATVDPLTLLIEQAATRLGRNFHERLDLPSLAQEMNVSYERFRKLFRERTGQSPGEYRIRRRIDQAKLMISQQRLSNKEIAYTLGYADPFTFSKQFKLIVGSSPAKFRGG